VPAQTGVYIRQDDRQCSVHEKDLPRQPRRFLGCGSGKRRSRIKSVKSGSHRASKMVNTKRTKNVAIGRRRRDDILEVL
jgi:hypothetical protein